MWHWETIDPSRSTQSGDIAKLFKNEAVKQPGVLAVAAAPADPTLLAREAIQNSWDAGRALKKELGDDAPHFRMRFVFESVEGAAKSELVAALGLDQLAARSVGDSADLEAALLRRRKLGLGEDDCLLHLDDPSVPLRVLKVVECATTGMFGPWENAKSRMYLAMVSIGFTVKAEGSGGSYGYGKSGLIRGSRVRAVVAHTCFREAADDPGVTRRLLGMTYWGGLDEFTGFARFGHDDGAAVTPHQNDAADAVAAQLGIGLRDPNTPKDLGSTFLLVDPAVTPEQLRIAVERNWWPAIEDPEVDFDVAIEDYEGHRHVPRPKKDPVLEGFIQGYHLAMSAPDNQADQEFRKELPPYQPTGHDKHALGTVGLTADLAGWSYAQNANDGDDDRADHQSLVALVRGPRMVVEYYSCGRAQPFVRGTFVAADDIDDLLRQTEPKAHDAWLARMDEEGIDAAAPKFAGKTLERIREAVRAFRKQLKPPPPREQDIHLPLLDDLFRSVLENRGGKNPPPPPADPRRVAIAVDQHVEAAGDLIRLRAKIKMRLTDRVDAAATMCRLFVRVAFDEDGRRGDDCPVDIPTALPDFEIDPNVPGKGTTMVGELDHDWLEIDVVSDPYAADWTAQLLVGGDLVEPAAVAS